MSLQRGVEGAADLARNIAAAKQRTIEGGRRGMLVAGLHVLGVSNAQAPHETGELIRSGKVSQDEASNLTVISYDTEYAVKQHEDMSLQHDDGRNAKFLENSLNSEREQVAKIIATAAGDDLGAGGGA